MGSGRQSRPSPTRSALPAASARLGGAFVVLLVAFGGLVLLPLLGLLGLVAGRLVVGPERQGKQERTGDNRRENRLHLGLLDRVSGGGRMQRAPARRLF